MHINLTVADTNQSRFEDIRKYYEIDSPDIIDELIGEMIILNRYAKDPDYLYERVVDIATCCWQVKYTNSVGETDVMQHYQIKFKLDVDDDMTFALPLNKFMFSLIFMRCAYDLIDNENIHIFLVEEEYLSADSLKKRQQQICDLLMSWGKGQEKIYPIISNMSLELKELAKKFGQANLQIYTATNIFLDHYRNSEIVREINNTVYPPGMQPVDIIEENNRRTDILIEEMTRLGNPMFVHNRYAPVLNSKQIQELFINYGQIPDGKELLQITSNGNGFKSGYDTPEAIYSGATAARVPNIVNKLFMGKAGYFTRNGMMLTAGTISPTTLDCGSRNPIKIRVDEMILDMFDGRWYYKYGKCRGPLVIFRRTDKHLIGKELWFRSPCTCNLRKDVCHYCYGVNSMAIGTLASGFTASTETITAEIQHNILKAKHILKANAERIEFSDNFSKFFTYEDALVAPINDKKTFDVLIRDDYEENISDYITFYIGKEMTPITISHYSIISIPEEIISKSKL